MLAVGRFLAGLARLGFVLLCLGYTLFGAFAMLGPAALQLMLPGELRGKAASILVLVTGLAGGDRCEVAHKWYVVSGRLKMRMQDGSELEWKAGDVGTVPPGHDAWVVGDEPFVCVDFEGGAAFAKRQR